MWPLADSILEIDVLENLDTLEHLRVLQLGNNKIRRIGNALSKNVNLEVIIEPLPTLY
jgi:hypothetical protein